MTQAAYELADNGLIEIDESFRPTRIIARITQEGRKRAAEILEQQQPVRFSKDMDFEVGRAEWAVLGELFRVFYLNETEGYTTATSIENRIFRSGNSENIASFLSEMDKIGVVQSFSNPVSENERMYRLTALGIYYVTQNYVDFVEQQYFLTNTLPDDIYDPIDHLFHSYRRLTKTDEIPRMQEIPAADRIVSIDHNNPQYGEALDKFDELIATLKTTNSYLANDAEDRARVLSEIEAGRKLLESRFVEQSLAKRLLLVPLAFLMTAFAGGAIGAMAADLYAILKPLIGF